MFADLPRDEVGANRIGGVIRSGQHHPEASRTIPEDRPVKKHLIPLAAVVTAFLVLAAACSDDEPEQTSTGAEETADDSDASVPAAEGTATVGTADSEEGEILVDGEGFSLYAFTPDEDADGTPTCTDACADTWPPLTVEGEDLPEGLDEAVFTVVEAPDGTFQLRAGDHPLYLFSGDSAPGDTNGQGSGDVWFLVAPDGSVLDGTAAAEVDDPEPADSSGSDYGY